MSFVSSVSVSCVFRVCFVCVSRKLSVVSCVFGVCLVCVWCVFGVCFVCAWCVFRVCFVCVWCMYRLCFVCVSCMSFVCVSCMFRVWLLRVALHGVTMSGYNQGSVTRTLATGWG